ncbi:MAG: hypothetical protein HYV42_01690 [Candidatus Magasanikbacteria bacterium]|nr:hypothetical protein [Candidatus Magasanikbacteria bacterium]
MLKIKQFVSTALAALMAVAATFAPVALPIASAQTITNQDLGIQYGAATGLGSTDVRVTVARIIRVAMGLLGIIAVVIILIGGFTWMTAGGNEEKVAEAKKWIFAGIIGLAIILSAYAIASFVINQLVTATTTGGTI